MKKFNLSLVAVLAMSTFAIAGGDIAPVEEPIVVVEEPVSEGNFYLGLAYGAANIDSQETISIPGQGVITPNSEDIDYGTIMLQAGYNFNPYIAVEGRYWIGLEEDFGNFGDTLTLDTWGLYVKPQYPVTEAFNIYALLGYASSDLTVDFPGGSFTPDYDLDGFSWGVGAAYSFTESVEFFIDYTSLYDDTNTVAFVGGSSEIEDTIGSWNFGVTYNF